MLSLTAGASDAPGFNTPRPESLGRDSGLEDASQSRRFADEKDKELLALHGLVFDIEALHGRFSFRVDLGTGLFTNIYAGNARRHT